MALSLILGEARLAAERMKTSAVVTLEQVGEEYTIAAVHLTLKAKIPGGPGDVCESRGSSTHREIV